MVLILNHTLAAIFLYYRDQSRFITKENRDEIMAVSTEKVQDAILRLSSVVDFEQLRSSIRDALQLALPNVVDVVVYLLHPDSQELVSCDGLTHTLPKEGLGWECVQKQERQQVEGLDFSDPLSGLLKSGSAPLSNRRKVVCSPVVDKEDDRVIAVLLFVSNQLSETSLQHLNFIERQLIVCYKRLKHMMSQCEQKSAHTSQASQHESILSLCADLYDQDAAILQLKVIQYLCEHTQAESGFLLLVALEIGEMTCQVIGDRVLEADLRFPLHKSNFAEVLRTKQPITLEHIQNDQREELSQHLGRELRSLLCVPVCSKTDEQVIAVMCMANKKGASRFTEADVDVIRHCFKYTATVLSSTIAFQNEQRLRNQTQTLLNVARNLFTHLGEYRSTPTQTEGTPVSETNDTSLMSSSEACGRGSNSSANKLKSFQQVENAKPSVNSANNKSNESNLFPAKRSVHINKTEGESVGCSSRKMEKNSVNRALVNTGNTEASSSESSTESPAVSEILKKQDRIAQRLTSPEKSQILPGRESSSDVNHKGHHKVAQSKPYSIQESPIHKLISFKQTSPRCKQRVNVCDDNACSSSSLKASVGKESLIERQDVNVTKSGLSSDSKSCATAACHSTAESSPRAGPSSDPGASSSPMLSTSSNPDKMTVIQKAKKGGLKRKHKAVSSDAVKNICQKKKPKTVSLATQTESYASHFEEVKVQKSPEETDQMDTAYIRLPQCDTQVIIYNKSPGHTIVVEDVDSKAWHAIRIMGNRAVAKQGEDNMKTDSGERCDSTDKEKIDNVNVVVRKSSSTELCDWLQSISCDHLPLTTQVPRAVSQDYDLTILLKEIMQEARNLTKAERCSVFLVEKETNELVAKVFDGDIRDSKEMQTEVRIPVTQGIAGHVATTGEILNIEDVYTHPLFYRGVDESTGFRTRNILCFPIKDENGVIIGVAQLCNKLNGAHFTQFDEEIAQAFSIYCCISIVHSLMLQDISIVQQRSTLSYELMIYHMKSLMYKQVRDAQHRSKLSNELMIYHMQTKDQGVSAEDVDKLTKENIPKTVHVHPDIDQFYFTPRSLPEHSTPLAVVSMMQDMGLIHRFRIRRETLARFVLMVKRGYRDPPYHNWSHAFAVAHFCYLLFKNANLLSYLDEIEVLALIIACLCHDIDHRGTNNSYQVASESVLAALYSSEGSVMERHHFAQTMCILNTEGCNIFENLSRKDYEQALDLMRDIILATDLAHHLRILPDIQAMTKGPYNRANPEHHTLLLCLCMTSCDLSDQTKNWSNSRKIAELIYGEFFSQGDLEKALGRRPLEMMDREKADIPDLQIGFLDGVALPVFTMLGEVFPEAGVVTEAVRSNRKKWTLIKEKTKRLKLVSNSSMDIFDVDVEDEETNGQIQ